MRRMNAFVAPSAIHDCHNLLRCATAAAGSARVIKPCARSVAPVVYPSSASGYIRRAPSLRWACRTNGADSANSCHGRSLRIVTCSATLTGSELQTQDRERAKHCECMTQYLLTQVLRQPERPCPRTLMLLALSSAFMTGMACWLETWLSILIMFLRGAN